MYLMLCFPGHVFPVTPDFIMLKLFSFYEVLNKKKKHAQIFKLCAGSVWQRCNTWFRKLKNTNENILVFFGWN